MSKFRKRPVIVEAIQCGVVNSDMPYWFKQALENGVITDDYQCLMIRTPEGQMMATPTDWIIRGIKGEIYPCKPDIFNATYDAVED